MSWAVAIAAIASALAALFAYLNKRADSVDKDALIAAQNKRVEALKEVSARKSREIHELQKAVIERASPDELADLLNRVFSKAASGGETRPVPTGKPPGVPRR